MQEIEILKNDDLEIISGKPDDLSVTTCYVKCKCEICKKEFMGFAGSVVCNESRCNREWMDKNIHSKLELAQALQKKVAAKAAKEKQLSPVEQDFENFMRQISTEFDFNDAQIKAVAWTAWNAAFKRYGKI